MTEAEDIKGGVEVTICLECDNCIKEIFENDFTIFRCVGKKDYVTGGTREELCENVNDGHCKYYVAGRYSTRRKSLHSEEAPGRM